MLIYNIFNGHTKSITVIKLIVLFITYYVAYFIVEKKKSKVNVLASRPMFLNLLALKASQSLRNQNLNSNESEA